MNSKVSVIKCDSYQSPLVLEALRRGIDLIGGITGFIKPGSRVLVKPNLLMAKEPQAGITTHPEVARAAVRILKEINCRVFIGDGPSVWGNRIEDVGQVYERTGIKKVAAEEGVELVNFDKRRWRKKFPLTTWLDDCDHVVNIPKFKTHELTVLTGAIKNLFGMVSGTFKTELHKNYFKNDEFCRVVVDIFEEVRPSLSIVDGIIAMEGDGPGSSGKLRRQNLLLASGDCVALDSVLAMIMGLEPREILTTKEACARGLGAADLSSITVVGEDLKAVTGRPFLLPATSVKKNIIQPFIPVIKKLMRYYPRLEQANCIRCLACIRACPVKAISMKNDRITFNYKGCIACFCCQEVCPASAIKVRKSLLIRMLGL